MVGPLQVMNDDIRIALSEKKAAFFKWKEMGRPNNPNNHYLNDKKRTTRLLRKEYRLEIARRRINARQELIQAREHQTEIPSINSSGNKEDKALSQSTIAQ
jgi:hypothetical protein